MSTEASNPKSAANLQGFTEEGLAEFDARFHALVDEGQQANVVNLIARRGQIVHCDAYGVQDVSATPPVPVKTDTIYRIASMTKPLTSAVAMMLWEEGKWALEDPVFQFIPEFEGLKVKQENGELVPEASPMTMRQLMIHTAGFAGRTEYLAELRAGDLQHMIDYLAKQPLSFQPGKEWRYGPSVDILGYIIEKLTSKQVDEVLQERLLGPLGMVDTGYVLPESKFERLVSNHRNDDNDKLQAIPLAGTYNAVRPRFIGAGGGLMLSTVKDYWRFCQMILNGGEFEGKRYLEASTVELMHTNLHEPGVTLNFQGRSFGPIGFGLGFAIVYDHVDKKTFQAAGSFWWGGLFGTWFWIDPVNDLIVIGFINSTSWHTPVGVPMGRELSAKLGYKALNT